MYEGEVHARIAVPAYDQPPEALEPGEGALDFPASLVAPQGAPILCLRSRAVASVRDDELDAALVQSLA